MNKKNATKQSGKRWVHPPASLTNGHVVYNVKLLGHTEVEQPKGADVVREAVRKLKFAKQLKRAEGAKPQKVELTISSVGVVLQDRQTKARLETVPLHRISYCADDKQDKRICAFICKLEPLNKNICFVMDSDKCAEEITLTVGQAFDLAYQQFMQTSGKNIGSQIQGLQKKVRELETENTKLRMRIIELEANQGQQPPPYSEHNSDTSLTATGASSQPTLLKDLMSSPSQVQPQPNPFQFENTLPLAGAVPPYASPPTAAAASTGAQAAIPVGTSPSGRPANGVDSSEMVQSPATPTGTSVTSRPRPHGIASLGGQEVPSLAPPPSSGRSRRGTTGAAPVSKQSSSNGSHDSFGQASFSQPQPVGTVRSTPYQTAASWGSSQDLDLQHYQELQEGFASGLTLGNEDLSLADLDPLKNLSNC